MVAGDPALLRSFTDEVSAVLPALHTAADGCSTAIAAYNDAPNDLPASDLTDVGAAYAVDAESLAELAAIPAAFATLVETADGDVGMLARLDGLLLETWLATPDFTDAEALLGELVGSPSEMADRIRALLADTDDLSEDEVDDLIAAFEDAMRDEQLSVGRMYNGVLVTEENQATLVWESVNARELWPDAVAPHVIDDLLDVSARLAVVGNDTEFATALFEDLGPEATAELPGLVARAAWSDTYTTGGHGFDAAAAMAPFSGVLAVASPALPEAFWDDVFDAGTTRDSVEDANLGWWDDHEAVVIDDAFPALFIAGGFAPDVAARAGQLGIDILHGQRADGLWAQVQRGQGSPFYDGFDRMSTHWEDRGSMLVEAAARTPEAATELLRDERNAAILTDNAFGRDDNGVGTEHTPSWDVVGDEVSDLIRAGTIENLPADPVGTREAAANVINTAVDENPGASHDALATTYSEVAVQYLPEIAADNVYTDAASVNREGGLSVGSLPATRFVALGMASEEGRAMLGAAHEVVAFDIVLSGVESQYAGQDTDWESRLGKLDAVMLGGQLGDSFDTAEDAQSAALDYNANLASGQGALLRAVGLAPHTKVLLIGAAPLADHIRTEYLEQATNQVEIAESEANVTSATALDTEERLVATGHLVAALRAEAALPPGVDLPAGQQAVLDVAAAEMDATTLAQLRGVAANGGDPEAFEQIDGGALAEDLDQLREAFAGREEWPVEDDYLSVAVWQSRHMSRFPAGLFVAE
jgi:hypothetical protein